MKVKAILNECDTLLANGDVLEAYRSLFPLLIAYRNQREVAGRLAIIRNQVQQKQLSNPPDTVLVLIAEMYQNGMLKKANRLCKKVNETFDQSAVLHNLHGVILDALDKRNLSELAYLRAIELAPDFLDPIYNLAGNYRQRKIYHKALEYYNKIPRHYHKYDEAMHNLAASLMGQGKYREAEKIYLNFTPQYENFMSTRSELGKCYLKMNELKVAEDIFSSVSFNCSKKNYDNQVNLAVTFIEQGRLEKAIDLLLTLKDSFPNEQDAVLNLGVAYQRSEQYQEAFDTFLALSENQNSEIKYSALVNLGVLAEKSGDLKLALKSYLAAVHEHQTPFIAAINAVYVIVQLHYIARKDLGINEVILKSLFENILIEPTSAPKSIALPKGVVAMAIHAFIEGNRLLLLNSLEYVKMYEEAKFQIYDPKDKIFVEAYYNYLVSLLSSNTDLEPKHLPMIYHLGDSHCLSFANSEIHFKREKYRIQPVITFGVKAYHLSQKSSNIYKEILSYNLSSIPLRSTVLISVGEIDCRLNEGFIPSSHKLNVDVKDLINNVVTEYVSWIVRVNESHHHQLYFATVPAPVYNKQFTVEENDRRSAVINLFNTLLAKHVRMSGYHVIDFHTDTVNDSGYSNLKYHLDDIHLSPLAVNILEKYLRSNTR